MGKQLTTDDFINKAKIKHSNKYDYSKVKYINNKTKIKIICPKHGEFEQIPINHLRGENCIQCTNVKQMNFTEFINAFNTSEYYNENYDFSKVKYINIYNKIIVIDKLFNTEHSIIPTLLLSGTKCGSRNAIDKNKYFIEKAKLKHGDKYDYSKVDYVGSNINIKIICPKHGEFEQRPDNHLQGQNCPKCVGGVKLESQSFINRIKEVHNNKYDYSHVVYINSHTKIKIICPEHGIFEQMATSHLKGQNCPKCAGNAKSNSLEFIERARLKHGDRYDYSFVDYTNADKKVTIICPEHGEFEQIANDHLSGKGCNKCSGKGKKWVDVIDELNKIHNYKYDYSKTNFNILREKVTIICPEHGEFEQLLSNHLNKSSGCRICNRGWENEHKLNLLNKLEYNDLLTMDPFEIYTIIGQGKLPTEFGTLAHTDAFSNERIVTIQELKERFNSDEEESDEIIVEEIENEPIDSVDIEITDIPLHRSEGIREPSLPNVREINDLHSLDNQLYASMDKEAFEGLVQYKLRKLWNSILNNEISLETLKNESGGQYFETIKELFFIEYDEAINYQPKEGYSFKFQPNLMQKLTVQRLLKAKAYGNWSGTGAGKTLSFIIASREIEAKVIVIIALNSTIKQTCKAIKEVYPNSVTFTDYKKGQVFDRNKNNYLVLNYEKFQQTKSEELFQSLTNNNQIDFIVIDEVHNAKQREEGDENESVRRGVLNRLMGRIRENNPELYTLVMSATPVINNLFEAKSLLSLLTGLEYDDINTRRTLPNALKIFQQLILHGLRYIPKYDIEMTELTGSNMSNLNIDGSHLLDTLLTSSSYNYINTEKLLLNDKLKAIQPYLRKGVIIYSYLTTGFINEIENYVRSLGYTTGTYTGEESTYIREDNLNKFIGGDIDILIGSRPIGTGVDGLQGVCNRMILITLPWTDSEYVQLKGRVYRQGSIFGDVEIIIPQVRINFDDDIWSWDVQRLNLIKNKKTLADAAVDGVVPSRILPSTETMHRKSQESLQRWKDRVNEGNIIENRREFIQIDLYPDVVDISERERRLNSELSEFNRRGKTTLSTTMNKEFNDNPESWFRYHKLRKERMDQWDEIPYEYIATKIKNRNHKVIDFGCGENLFKNSVPFNEVISFDHIAIDENVIACDIKDISEYVSDESVDIAVFSLALWGTNYRDYIKEAFRVLNYGGVIHIAEPVKDYETSEDEQEFINLITESGFTIVGGVEKRGKFIYISGIKI